MNPKQYLKDYYSNSPNDNILDQLSNFGSEAGGGKAAINGIVTGISSPVRAVAEGFTKGTGALASKLTGTDFTNAINKNLNDINNFFTNDSLTDSVSEYPVIDTIANYGTSLAGGTALARTPLGLTTISRNTAKGMRAGLNEVGMVADSAISKSIANEQGKDKPLTLNNIGSSIINGVGNIVKQPIKGGIYATNALNSMLASTDIAENRIKQKRDNELNSVDSFFNYK